ncbi:MAG: FGGY-family carbohydrate kinase [Candidatus Omnitrophica bacterium]|nr:FGGY-family carbohydrate kinase [Candidatus Omnitrophota bacterium]
MPKEIFLGIDLGTTVLKICAVDGKSGAILAHDACRIPVQSLSHSGREQKISDIDRLFRKAVHTLQDRLGAEWRRIAGIGLAAQGGSTIIADRSSGRALTPMILWDDGRTAAYTAQLKQKYPPSYWRKSLLCDAPPAGLGRLIWLNETQPALFCDSNIHIGAGEYLFYQLTGVWRQDAGNAIQIGSYNAAKKKLFSAFLKIAGAPLSFVAPLRQDHETSPLSAGGARRLNLPRDVPVAGPYIDQEAGYLSASGASNRPLQCSLGTAWVGNFILPGEVDGASPTQLAIPSPLGPGRLVIQPLLTGNMTWEWGLRQFVENKDALPLEEADKIFQSSWMPENPLIFLPWLDQANPLARQTAGAGVFYGISSASGRADMLRALAAGLCFELARMFEELKQRRIIDAVALGGGAGKGRFFQTILAGLFAPLPVFQQKEIDFSAARGALYAFNPRIAQTRVKRIRTPDQETAVRLHDYYQHYLRVFSACYPSEKLGRAFHIEKSQSC